MFFKEGSRSARYARSASIAAVIFHALYLATVSSTLNHPPITGPYESMSTLAILLAAFHLFMEKQTESRFPGVAVFAVAFLLQLASSFLISTQPADLPMTRNVIFVAHVLLALMGYTAFTIAFLYSIMYLLMHREIRSGSFSLLYRRLPSIEELDDMNYLASLNGLVLLLISLILGGVWSYVNFAELPVHDPKVLLTVFAVVVYVTVLVFKLMFGWHGRRIAVASICAFLLVVSSLVIANFLPYSFHGM